MKKILILLGTLFTWLLFWSGMDTSFSDQARQLFEEQQMLCEQESVCQMEAEINKQLRADTLKAMVTFTTIEKIEPYLDASDPDKRKKMTKKELKKLAMMYEEVQEAVEKCLSYDVEYFRKRFVNVNFTDRNKVQSLVWDGSIFADECNVRFGEGIKFRPKYGRGHYGKDLLLVDATKSQYVSATDSFQIVFKGWYGNGGGNTLKCQSLTDTTVFFTYMHLDYERRDSLYRGVQVGDTLIPGQMFAKVSKSGLEGTKQPKHLHLELEKDGYPYDTSAMFYCDEAAFVSNHFIAKKQTVDGNTCYMMQPVQLVPDEEKQYYFDEYLPQQQLG